jgi:hypothetical protein
MAMAGVESAEILQSGWLEKKGRVIKNWKRRWFTLKEDLLEYYDAPGGAKKGDIDITKETSVLMRDGSTHLFKFGIKTNDRILELCTSSDPDRLQWMDAIHNAVKCLKNSSKASGESLKGRVSNLLSKKTNMEEDTPMNRAMRGHGSTTDTATCSGKTTTRRTTTRRRKKTTPLSPSERPTEDFSDESDRERETNDNAPLSETAESLPPPQPPLPEGWAQVMTEDGRIYYYHKVTRVSRWDFPTAESETAPPVEQEQTRQSTSSANVSPPLSESPHLLHSPGLDRIKHRAPQQRQTRSKPRYSKGDVL